MLKPLGDRVIIEIAEEEKKTVEGIVLASATKEKPQTGTVVIVGEGRLLENGEKVPVTVKAGGQIMFERYASTEIKYERKKYLIVAGRDIVAIIE